MCGRSIRDCSSHVGSIAEASRRSLTRSVTQSRLTGVRAVAELADLTSAKSDKDANFKSAKTECYSYNAW